MRAPLSNASPLNEAYEPRGAFPPPPRMSGKVFRKGTHLGTLAGHTNSVTGLDVMPLSGHLVSCSLDCTIRIWDYKTGKVLEKFTHYEEFKCLALRQEDPFLAM